MDKSTNAINITIGAVMLVNSFFVLFFSELFRQPRAVSSIMGVIFFVLNAAFSLILLLFTLITCTMALLSKNPDSRYKPAGDDRHSFIRDQKHEPTDAAELTALGVAMRADHEESFVNDVHNIDEEQMPRAGNWQDDGSTDSAYERKNPFSEKSVEDRSLGQDQGSNYADTVEYPNTHPVDSLNTTSTPRLGSDAPSFEFEPTNPQTHKRSESSRSIIDSPKSPKTSKWKLFEKKE